MAPASADLLIKLAIGAGVIAAGVIVARRAAAAAGEPLGRAWNTATAAAHSISPFNNDNVIYQTANSVPSALTGRDETVGGAAWEITDAVSRIFGRGAGQAPRYEPTDGTPTYDAFGTRTN